MNVKGNVFIVSAPSGAGKTSLVKRLINDTDNIQVAVSHTTRPARQGDVDGQDYYFVERPTFEQMMTNGDFVEYAEVFGNYYGTSHLAIERCLGSGSDVILEIDWQGAAQVRQKMSDVCSVFILPPSRDILLQRLRGRGTDSDEVIERRTLEAVEEMKHLRQADFLLINDDFETTLAELQAIVLAGRLRMERQTGKHRDLIEELLR